MPLDASMQRLLDPRERAFWILAGGWRGLASDADVEVSVPSIAWSDFVKPTLEKQRVCSCGIILMRSEQSDYGCFHRTNLALLLCSLNVGAVVGAALRALHSEGP